MSGFMAPMGAFQGQGVIRDSYDDLHPMEQEVANVFDEKFGPGAYRLHRKKYQDQRDAQRPMTQPERFAIEAAKKQHEGMQANQRDAAYTRDSVTSLIQKYPDDAANPQSWLYETMQRKRGYDEASAIERAKDQHREMQLAGSSWDPDYRALEEQRAIDAARDTHMRARRQAGR